MNFNRHLELEGKHAFLGASKYHWLNYDNSKLSEVFLNEMQKERGTRLHAFAQEAIDLGIYLKGNGTLALFVKDAINFRMSPETVLCYSENCFGTADAISFRQEKIKTEDGESIKKDVLRIHDLKTGKNPASEKQLMIYAALFCLEYRKNPTEMYIELRIYQFNNAFVFIPNPEEIQAIMNKIVEFDDQIEDIKKEA